MRILKVVTALLAGLALWACSDQDAVTENTPAPDLVLIGGKLLTVDENDSIAEALAIKGGKISAVGTAAEIRALIGKDTKVIELEGRTVIPGLIDSHIHAIRAGLTWGVELSWSDAASLEEGLQRIREAAKVQPEGSWIAVIGGWHPAQFPEKRLPTAADIADIAPNHKVYVQYIYREAVLNANAMEALGLREDSDLPPMGKLERDADGKLTGRITGNVPTFARLYSRLPKPDIAQQKAGTLALFSELTRLGMTGIIDAAGGGMPRANYDVLFDIWKAGELPLRVTFRALPARPGNELADIKAWLGSLPEGLGPRGLGDDWLKFGGFGEVIIWGMHDGDRTGLSFTPKPEAVEALREAATWLAQNGQPLEIHASSDSSAQIILDVFTGINEVTPIADLRWAIAHLEDASPGTLQRMKELGISWSVQDRLYFAGDEVKEVLGEEGALRAPPIVSALAEGILVAGGTDSTRASLYNPWISIGWLLDGKSVSGATIRGPAESPNRAEALRIYTWNSAWMGFSDKERGSIEVGKFADIAVLSADYMTVPVSEVSRLTSLLTMVGGKVVHSSGGFAE